VTNLGLLVILVVNLFNSNNRIRNDHMYLNLIIVRQFTLYSEFYMNNLLFRTKYLILGLINEVKVKTNSLD
jgi:hypothetical protein